MERIPHFSEPQDLLSPQNAYHKMIECKKYYVGSRLLTAVEEVEKYLHEIRTLEEKLKEKDPNDILSIQAENLIAIKFFFGNYLAMLTSRVFRFDEEGNETKSGETLMKDIRSLLPHLQNFLENDHILHVKLVHIYCQIRLLNLNLEENMEKIDDLFHEAKIWKDKCGRTRECIHVRTMLGTLFVGLSFRANRKCEAELMACQIWEEFSQNDDVKALKSDHGISLELGQLCQYHLEKARLVHDEEQEIRYTKKALWYLENAIGGKETIEVVCRVNQNLAVKAIRQENDGVLGCFMGGSHRKALKYMDKSHSGWRRMIKRSGNNLKHTRYQSHMVYRNYLKYEIKHDPKYVRNMETIFAELFDKILGSPELDNLEILEAMLRVTCEMKSFSRALEICSDSKKIRDPDKLIYPFGPILKLVEQISVLNTVQHQSVLEKHLSSSQKVFEKAILQLKESKHPVCSFWYNYGINAYFHFLQKSGQSMNHQQMLKFSSKIKHFTMGTSMSWQSMNSWSSNSSAATLTEILEAAICDMDYDFLLFAERNIQPEIFSSTEALKSTISGSFNVSPGRFRFYTNEKLLFQQLDEEFVWRNAESQLLLLLQVSDQRNDLRSIEEIKQWVVVGTRAAKFTWAIVQTVYICRDEDPEFQGPANITYLPSHEDGGEIIVTSSFTKVEQSKFDATPTRKYLSDALAAVLRNETARLVSEEGIETSRCGERSLCVQDICTKMREECCLNWKSYLSAKPVPETSNTKELRITFPSLIVN